MAFEAYRADGVLQINDQRGNYLLKTKGSVVANTPVGNAGAGYKEIAVTQAHAPIIALSCPVKATACLKSVDGNTWTYRIFIGDRTTYCEYYVFDTFVPSASNFGLHVYDTAGRLTFDSNKKPMRVVGFHKGSTEESEWTYPSGRNYAFIPATGGGGQTSVNTGSISNRTYVLWHASACLNVSTNKFRRGSITYQFQEFGNNQANPYGPDWSATSDWLIVDVTDF